MNKPKIRGFTLVEAIITIVITGVIAGMISIFIRSPVDSYIDSVLRADLTDAADTALRRMTRDVRTALPNSIRTAGGDACFEFLPAKAGGRYRFEKSESGTGDALDFSVADGSFDVLAGNNMPAFVGNEYVAIYNLGIAGADAYEAVGSNRASIAGGSSASNIQLATNNKFPLESPARRFHVIPNHSMVYSCADGKLFRSTRALTNTALSPLASCPASGDVVVANVSACSFTYTPAVHQRNGQLTMRLELTMSGETVSLYHEVHIDNVP